MSFVAGGSSERRFAIIAVWIACVSAQLIPGEAVAQTCVAPPGQIVRWWRGEGNSAEVTGGIIASRVANATYTNGLAGFAFSFDGDGDAFLVGNPSALQLQDFTIEAWSRRFDAALSTAAGGSAILVGYGLDGYAFGISDDGRLLLQQTGAGDVHTSPQITNTAWHHVAVTKSSDTVVFYVDGAAMAPFTFNVNFLFHTPLAIGARGDVFANSFLGAIDELAIYSRPLAAGEIAAIYSAGNQGKCSVPTAPSITSQPADQFSPEGGAGSLQVVAAGTPPLRYQWTFHATNLIGATNFMLSFAGLQTNNEGDYQVVVTNASGAITSAAAILVVLPPPAIAVQPASCTNFIGETNSFTIGATGAPPLGYQWRFNGANLGGATRSALVLENIQSTHAGSYTVVVSNRVGMATSAPALLVLKLPPAIVTQPQSQSVAWGTDLALVVDASGDQPLFYYWRSPAFTLPPTTNAYLALFNLQLSDSGSYCVIVSNRYGTVLSSNAVLTVTNPACLNPPAGLVGWWRGQSNTLDTVSGTAATPSGDLVFTNGRVGLAFSFNGNGNGVVIGNPPNLQLQNFTIEAWIQRHDALFSSGIPGDAMLIGYGDSGYGLGIMDDGRLYLTQTGVGAAVTTPQIIDTAWHHVAVTKSGPMVIFYVDGTALPAFSYNPVFTFSVTNALGIGARGDNLANGFLGAIDEPSIYNRALPASEILEIYLIGNQGKCSGFVAPYLTVKQTSGAIVVSWPSTFPNYGLVSATSLNAASVWSPVDTNLILRGATNNSLSQPIAPGNKYYRLKSP